MKKLHFLHCINFFQDSLAQRKRHFQHGGQGPYSVATIPCWAASEIPHPTGQITYDVRVLAEGGLQRTKSKLTASFSEGRSHCGLDNDLSRSPAKDTIYV